MHCCPYTSKIILKMCWNNYYLLDIATCEPSEFQCNDTQCIDSRWRCDGDFDCNDHSDEMNCPSNYSNCADNEWACKTEDQCIHKSWKCDGDDDCADGTDEKDCKCHSSYARDSFRK